MERTAVFGKSAKGVEELKTRTHGLPQKLRALLIMVDGKSDVGQLLDRFPGIPEFADNLRTLLDQGFIAVVGGDASPASPSAPGPTSSRASESASAGQTREEALRGMTRFLLDSLGPDADMVTGALEDARTRAEFDAAAARCATMLEGLAGRNKADVFRDRARAYAARFLGS